MLLGSCTATRLPTRRGPRILPIDSCSSAYVTRRSPHTTAMWPGRRAAWRIRSSSSLKVCACRLAFTLVGSQPRLVALVVQELAHALLAPALRVHEIRLVGLGEEVVRGFVPGHARAVTKGGLRLAQH